jgi:hypothetical protein
LKVTVTTPACSDRRGTGGVLHKRFVEGDALAERSRQLMPKSVLRLLGLLGIHERDTTRP